MNIAGINYESVKDGIGVRTVIYASGCSHKCPLCHNPETHDPNGGISFTKEVQEEILKEIEKRPFVSGLTWSGGDPLHENNLEDVLEFSNKFRVSFPYKSIWLYSGYTWEEIMDRYYDDDDFSYISESYEEEKNIKREKIIRLCDVFVDGRYIDEQRDITLPWRGSSNQCVIDVKKSIRKGEVILWKQ